MVVSGNAPPAEPSNVRGPRLPSGDTNAPGGTRMQYFVTGATGFIGKRLVKTLLARRGSTVYFLLRPESEGKVADLLAFWGVTKARACPVFGDLTTKKLGVAADD